MSNAILICTNNLVPVPLFNKVLNNAFIQADITKDTFIFIVSHYPVLDDFIDMSSSVFLNNCKKVNHDSFGNLISKYPIFRPGEMFNSKYCNLVIGEREYDNNTIYRQMILGCEAANEKNIDNIIIMEHDVLYPLNYLRLMSGALNSGMQASYWANGKFFSESGFYDVPNMMTLSRFALRADIFNLVFKNKLNNGLKFVEPVLKGLPIYGNISDEKEISTFSMLYGIDTLDIRHGLNVTGNLLVDSYSFSHEYWGDYNYIYDLINIEYRDFVSKHTYYNYGILS